MKSIRNLLKSVPNGLVGKAVEDWIEEGRKRAQSIVRNSVEPDHFIPMEWQEIEEAPVHPFGLYASKNWRKFVLSVFLADLVCYPKPSDQVTLDRLSFLMHSFPKGFRVWWLRHSDGTWWPAGYTGWYPLSPGLFEIFEKSPEGQRDRMVVPDLSHSEHPFINLFNYSIAAPLKKTIFSKDLVKKYSEEITVQNYAGLVSITVSLEGQAVAKRFGMTFSGHLGGQDHESVFTTRSHPS